MLFAKEVQQLKGYYIVDSKTKNLLRRIRPNQIAILDHLNIDVIAAKGLIEKRVKAIINLSASFTGDYPTLGLKNLLEANILIFDLKEQSELLSSLKDEQFVEIDVKNHVAIFNIGHQKQMFDLELWTIEKWKGLFQESKQNLEKELSFFIDNTLEYASKEKDFVLKPLSIPPLKTQIQGKHVVVIVRGNHYQEDLSAIQSYIRDVKPILIGVDGGADALIEYGWKPDIIIGDMDSVSDHALYSGAEIIVHAYSDGTAPGLQRIRNMGLDTKIIPSIGTSEDVALLLAYEKQAEIIVALGAHSHLIDFLEKGRKGMASTVLVRMKVGTKLIDAKGVNKLYQPQLHWKSQISIALAAITPFIAIGMINGDAMQFLQMMWVTFKMLFM
ncbi:putative cytokinetic ring protein SteA [Tepidibacillus marianensis]|uniref:putative cytokinetic ring protein SteA n=1 Tax=Tepidibacillus marianensis TaxID=3131995 RepID=UPI0030CB30C1